MNTCTILGNEENTHKHSVKRSGEFLLNTKHSLLKLSGVTDQAQQMFLSAHYVQRPTGRDWVRTRTFSTKKTGFQCLMWTISVIFYMSFISKLGNFPNTFPYCSCSFDLGRHCWLTQLADAVINLCRQYREQTLLMEDLTFTKKTLIDLF